MENSALKTQLESGNIPPPIIGESGEIKKIVSDAERLPDSRLNALIGGESGTGKEILARRIHYHGPKRYGPFIALNGASIPLELLETEWFGHEKGSFTGATRKTTGLLEVADSGAFFLDEVENLSVAVQGKAFMRAGGAREFRVNTRIIAEREFHKELYDRLNVVVSSLPPLRNRISDAPLLGKHFLEETCGRNSLSCTIEDETIETLKNFFWPGDIRELRNVIERIEAFYDPADPHSLESILASLTGDKTAAPPECSVEMPLEKVERHHIRRVLEETSWNENEASKILEIDYTTLFRKIKKYGIEAPQKKERIEQLK